MADSALSILRSHDLTSLSPKVRFLARLGPPFVIHPHPMRTLRITKGGPERAK